MKLWRWLVFGAGIGALLLILTLFALYQTGHIEVISKVSSGGTDHGD